MGLFDGFQFDPNSFDSGGLLAQLRSQLQANQPSPLDDAQWPAGPKNFYGQDQNVAVGNYQMPQFGQAPQPDPAAIPQNARPAQLIPQQAQPAASPEIGLGDRLSGLFNGYANNRERGVIGGLVGAVTGLATGNAPENQTVKALVARGLDPATAQTIARDPSLLRAAIPQLMGSAGQTDDIKEYQFAKREDPTLTFEKFMQRKRSVSGEYGMQPIWGTGPDGKPAVMQLGKNGAAVASKMPEGFALSRDPIKVEGPTGTTILDPQTRQQVGFIPKDVSGAAKAKEIGEAEGQATVNLPTAIASAENTLKTINQLREHPGKQSWGALGMGAMLPDMPGTDTRGFGALVDQVKGQNFMTAFQSLKGAGAITEQEGAKAERAQARLDRAQSPKDFDIALKDLEDVVIAGMARARQKAGQGGAQATSAASPAKPSVDDLLKKYGG